MEMRPICLEPTRCGPFDTLHLEKHDPAGFRRPYRWGGAYYQDIDVRQYTEGRLAIDVFDGKLKRPVWHGFATKTISSADQADPQKAIDAAVAAIVAEFPPGQ
jgi:hypothetical protein